LLLTTADAQSRRQHETGLKHSGNKERFIRDLYRNGNKAKLEKEEEAVQIARIEAVSPLRDFADK
jgi:WW domain-binding protein 4